MLEKSVSFSRSRKTGAERPRLNRFNPDGRCQIMSSPSKTDTFPIKMDSKSGSTGVRLRGSSLYEQNFSKLTNILVFFSSPVTRKGLKMINTKLTNQEMLFRVEKIVLCTCSRDNGKTSILTLVQRPTVDLKN